MRDRAGSPSNDHSCDPVYNVELRAGARASRRTARAIERATRWSTASPTVAGRTYRCKTNGDWYTLCRAGSIRSGRWVYISHSGELPGR
jgi:hypothetical protein